MENEEKQNTEEPHVRIFNTDANSWGKDSRKDSPKQYHIHHHEHSGGGIFGLALLFAGILLLLNNFGTVSREVWNYILPFWPVFLILIGLRVMAGFSRIVNFFVFILAFVLFGGIVIYALIHVNSLLVYNFYIPQGFVGFISQFK